MGPVTDHLLQLLQNHVDRHGVLVWYDPQGHYSGLVAASNWSGTAVHTYQGSFFLLRHEIEPLLAGDRTPRLIIYVNKDRSATDHALAEAEAGGVVLEPGAPGARDTALATLGREALRRVLSQQSLDEVLSNETLTLADLDRIAQGAGPVTGALSVVFGASASPSDVALDFVAKPDVDDSIVAKSAEDELAALLVETYGLPAPPSQGLSDLRRQLTRRVLLTDFRAALPNAIASQVFAALSLPNAPWQIQACQVLASRWRDSVKYRGVYKAAANQVDQDYTIQHLDLPLEAWETTQTFPSIEILLLESAGQSILQGAYPQAIALAENRQGSFWNVEDNALRWSLIRAAASLLVACGYVHEELRGQSWSAGDMVRAYALGSEGGAEPWCILDTLHRHMERLYAGVPSTPTLDQAVGMARKEYAAVTQRTAELLADALPSGDFQVPDVAQQINTFRQHVAPQLQKGKTAYLWIDALRFEMARELLAGLPVASESTLIPALSALPTLTAVGMAALLPGAEGGMGLVDIEGQLAVEINGRQLTVRGERVEYLTQRGGYQVEPFILAEVLKPNRAVKERISRAQLVVISSQEIDRIGEQQVPYLARSVMDDVLMHIKRALGSLAQLGVDTFVIASDHGFLFGDELSIDMLVDPPGGQTVKLTERVWVGRGGTTPTGCLRVKASDVGMGGDLEFVFPKGLASFRVPGGAQPYCHGGLSLQEMVVPVVIVQLAAAQARVGEVTFSLGMDRPRVTSRVFTVAASYAVAGLFDVTSRPVRCLSWHRGEIVARAVAAAYGYDETTGQVILEKERVNYITLMLTRDVNQGSLMISLLDPATEAELARLDDVPIEISI